MKKQMGFISLVIWITLIAACAPAATATASPTAVLTKVKQATPNTAMDVIPISNTPTNTNTPATHPMLASSTSTQSDQRCADAATFIADVTIPDGTLMTPGQAFTKTWRLKNSGSCIWTTAYTFGLEEGPANAFWSDDTPHLLTTNFKPGESMDITVNLSAPTIPGDYTASYQLRTPMGIPLLNFTAVIKVQEQAVTGFTVTNVSYVTSTWSDVVKGGQYTDCPLVTATITTNGAGTVNYYWLLLSISDQHQEGEDEDLVFDSAGSKTVSWRFQVKDTPRAAAIYIASPNNASFSASENLIACSATP